MDESTGARTPVKRDTFWEELGWDPPKRNASGRGKKSGGDRSRKGGGAGGKGGGARGSTRGKGGAGGSGEGSGGGRGGKRRPDPGEAALSRRSVLLGGGILLGGAGFITAGALDLLPGSGLIDTGPKITDAIVSKPLNGWLLTTTEWGARPPSEKIKVRTEAPRYIVVHHTSTTNVDDFSLERAHRLARAIQKSHFDRGWPDSGQHFTISRGGHILEGRTGSFEAARKGHMVVGTQVANANDYTVGIECEGNYNKELPPKELIDSLVQLCSWLCVQYELNPREVIVPHRKFNKTDCCGDKFAPTLPKLREAVAKAVPRKLLG